MPVRKIPKNYLGVTGSFAGRKNAQMDAFESLLEKEYMLLLDFHDSVERFEAQPITIPVPGVPRGYTPDILVHFLPDPNTGEIRKPRLTEVKHTDDLRRNVEKYRPKFEAAEQFASRTGWEFCIATELDIRTPRLANIKFLREYRNFEPNPNDLDRVLDRVRLAGGTTTVDELLEQLATSNDERLHWLPVLWHAVLIRHVRTDLDKPLGRNPVLHAAGGRQ
jgi:hypothetical protein